VNDKHYKPITNETHKVVTIQGTNYIPVHKVDKETAKTKDVIKTNTVKKVNTFNVKNVHYIPSTVVPKVYTPLFKINVPPKPQPPKPVTRVIPVNGEFYKPIVNKKVDPITIGKTTFVPVHKVHSGVVIRKPIKPTT